MTDTNRAILIKLRDPAALARAQGPVASFAQAVAPSTIEGKVYEGFRDQLAKSLKEKAIDADIQIVQPSSFIPADSAHVAADLGFALGGAGLVGIFWFLFGGRK